MGNKLATIKNDSKTMVMLFGVTNIKRTKFLFT